MYQQIKPHLLSKSALFALTAIFLLITVLSQPVPVLAKEDCATKTDSDDTTKSSDSDDTTKSSDSDDAANSNNCTDGDTPDGTLDGNSKG